MTEWIQGVTKWQLCPNAAFDQMQSVQMKRMTKFSVWPYADCDQMQSVTKYIVWPNAEYDQKVESVLMVKFKAVHNFCLFCRSFQVHSHMFYKFLL